MRLDTRSSTETRSGVEPGRPGRRSCRGTRSGWKIRSLIAEKLDLDGNTVKEV